ncbi:hypothetical protein KJ656_05645 [bacterium]|nr:hypothetical protein [bacterium]
MGKKTLSQKELQELTGLKHAAIDYLVREKIIPCVRLGRSIPRQFPLEAVKIIKVRLAKLNASE